MVKSELTYIVQTKAFVCNRCGHNWLPKKPASFDRPPICCPACKSCWWKTKPKPK